MDPTRSARRCLSSAVLLSAVVSASPAAASDPLTAVPASDSVLAVLTHVHGQCRLDRSDPVTHQDVLVATLPGDCPIRLDVSSRGDVALASYSSDRPPVRIDLRTGDAVALPPPPEGALFSAVFDAKGDILTITFVPAIRGPDGKFPATMAYAGTPYPLQHDEGQTPGLAHAFVTSDGRTWRHLETKSSASNADYNPHGDGVLSHLRWRSMPLPAKLISVAPDDPLLEQLDQLPAARNGVQTRWDRLEGHPDIYVRSESGDEKAQGATLAAAAVHGHLKVLADDGFEVRGEFLLGRKSQELWSLADGSVIKKPKTGQRIFFWPRPATAR